MLLLLQLLLVVLLGCGVQAFLLPAVPSTATTTTAPPPAHRCGYYPSGACCDCVIW
jgi:hypothetical protein